VAQADGTRIISLDDVLYQTMPWASSRTLFDDWSYNETFEVSTPVCELLVLVPPTVAPKVSSTTTGDEKLEPR